MAFCGAWRQLPCNGRFWEAGIRGSQYLCDSKNASRASGAFLLTVVPIAHNLLLKSATGLNNFSTVRPSQSKHSMPTPCRHSVISTSHRSRPSNTKLRSGRST